MVRLKVAKNTQVNVGGVVHEGGATIDVSDEEAAGLVAARIAEPVTAGAKQVAKADVEDKAVTRRTRRAS